MKFSKLRYTEPKGTHTQTQEMCQSDLSFSDFLNGVNATPPTAVTALYVVDNAVPATHPTPPTTVAALL